MDVSFLILFYILTVPRGGRVATVHQTVMALNPIQVGLGAVEVIVET